MRGQSEMFAPKAQHTRLEIPAEPPPRFGGATYEPERDSKRLTGQLLYVWEALQDGKWHTLPELRLTCETRSGKRYREQSISARLRDLRKPQFGGHDIRRRRITSGLYEYRLAT